MKTTKLIILLFALSVFTISCAAKDNKVLLKDINRYATIEKELNLKIKDINKEMVVSITKAKNTKDMKAFKVDNIVIEKQLKHLLDLAYEVKKYIKTKEVQKYHKYTIKSLEVQSEYVKENLKQFKTKGEHDRKNNAKLTQIKYGKKIRKIQKDQTEYLKKVLKKINKRKKKK